MKRARLTRLLVPLLAAAAIGGLVLAGGLRRSRGVPLASADSARPMRGLLQLASSSDGAPGLEVAESKGRALDALDAMFASRSLIRTATFSIEVQHFAQAAEKAASIAVSHGGFLADAKSSRGAGDRESGTLTLRVPADRFAAAMEAVKALGKVETATVDTQDITKEYADLATRLSAKRDAVARLREILGTRTGSVADLVEAEKELSRLIEEAERLEGERRYYDRQVALSTITVELAEPAAFLRDGALSPLSDAIRGALPLLSRSAAAMVYAIAAVLPWAVLAVLIWKLRRRTSGRRLVAVSVEAED
jgi:hypothetical protein